MISLTIGRSILRKDVQKKPADLIFFAGNFWKIFSKREVMLMKMFYVIYAEAADEEIINAFKESGFKSYTKMTGVMGEGDESEPKLGTHYWPGKNNSLLMAVSDEKIKPLCELVRKLKVEHPRAGLRAFTFPLDAECV
jgi:hypothetical protein